MVIVSGKSVAGRFTQHYGRKTLAFVTGGVILAVECCVYAVAKFLNKYTRYLGVSTQEDNQSAFR